jgi:hypothetical protein
MRKVAVVVSTMLLLAASASAEVRSIDVTVFGMD